MINDERKFRNQLSSHDSQIIEYLHKYSVIDKCPIQDNRIERETYMFHDGKTFQFGVTLELLIIQINFQRSGSLFS